MPTNSTPGRRLAAPLPLLLLALVGCTDANTSVANLPRKAVNGTVTLDGQPLAQGTIYFEPVAGGPGMPAATSAGITDGKYAIDRSGGPVPGKYKVSISSRAAITSKPGEPLPKPEPEKVPAQFSTKSTLTKEINDEGASTIDFDLKRG